MKINEFVAEYLTFSRRDRIGILVILFVILAVFFLPTLLHFGKPKPAPADTSWVAAVQRLEIRDTVENNEKYSRRNFGESVNDYQYDQAASNHSWKNAGELFYFDPNTLSVEGWTRLGLREKTIHTIQNYLGKGGHFRTPEDLKRVYGLFPDEYERIAPYIKIEPAPETDTKNQFKGNSDYAKAPVSPRYSIVDINSGDTSSLIALPGIGSKLAARIVNFRDKLGGFYSVEQVGETYGLPDSTFQMIKQYLKLENTSVRKININTATLEELKAHPYIRWNIAKPLVAYRTEHGPFTKLEDLKKVMVVTEEVYTKILPYLAL